MAFTASSTAAWPVISTTSVEGERAFTQDLPRIPGQEALARDNPGIAYRYNLGDGFKASAGWEPV